MIPRSCYACGNPRAFGCIMGGSCPKCGAWDTAAGRFWFVGAEQPHYRELETTLSDDPNRAQGQIDALRKGIAATLDVKDPLGDDSILRPAAEAMAGKKIRIVVAIEVMDT